ncbi:response regulator receiver protein [Pseudomonas sp. FSL R10-2172]|nr:MULTISPECIES: helix-turn-helix domain-containing protein [unclassified Pseudomonas]MQU14660.1 response regulator receiver protein [Pseudomonas sp. FSL R10-2189]MQU40371.1 response regulator receiver protein [Pseudomonas sp. FSL R10-2172]
MLFAGCQTDAQTCSVINFAHTTVLIDDIQKIVFSNTLHINPSDLVTSQMQNFENLEAAFVEIHTQDVLSDSIDLVKKIRQTNKKTCIFILITHTKSFSGTNFYIAGADHCVKLYGDQQERQQLLSEALENSHWKSPAHLQLDRTRLLLCSSSKKIEISYTEMTIIEALLNAPEHVMSQDSIAKTLDPNIVFYDPRALEKTISRLRTKIKKAYNLELILSVRAYGYRLRRCTVS